MSDRQAAADLLATSPLKHTYRYVQNQPAATVKAKNYLRSLLSRHEGGPKAEMVRLFRVYFNAMREVGTIHAKDVSDAIHLLTN